MIDYLIVLALIIAIPILTCVALALAICLITLVELSIPVLNGRVEGWISKKILNWHKNMSGKEE